VRESGESRAGSVEWRAVTVGQGVWSGARER
jgi:hypothetical protein